MRAIFSNLKKTPRTREGMAARGVKSQGRKWISDVSSLAFGQDLFIEVSRVSQLIGT